MAQSYVAFTALLYLLGVTRSIRPEQQRSADSPRAFATWSREELDLLRALQEHGVPLESRAQLLDRTKGAIQKVYEDGRVPVSLTRYPRTAVQLCQRDLPLLAKHIETRERDPLLWAYGQPLPSNFWMAASEPTLRIIRVSTDPLTAQWRPGPDSPLYWESFRHDASAAAQAVRMDLAAQIIQAGGTVLIPPPDPHRQRLDQLREALRRLNHDAVPRGSVRIFNEEYRPSPGKLLAPTLVLSLDRWQPAQVAQLPYQTLITVLPDLSQQPAPPELETAARTELAKSTANLPLRVRYDSQYTWQQYAALEHQMGQSLRITGRQHEELRFIGLPNAGGQPARLDWVALNVLPAHGSIAAINQEILIRSVVWFALRQGAWPRTDFTRHPFPLGMTASGFHDTYSDLSPSSKLLARLQLDLLGAELSQNSALSFSVLESSQSLIADYVGS